MSAIKRTIDKLTANRAELVAKRDAILEAAEAEDRTTLNDTEAADFATLDTDIRAIDDRMPELEADLLRDVAADQARTRLAPVLSGTPSIRVGAEPMTYRKGGEYGYFRDLAASRSEAGADDQAQARERLQRHRQEVDTLRESAGMETRANMTRTDGAGGEFVPPLWLMEQYLPLARAGRVTADLCRKMPLPAGTDSINIPKVSTGAAAAEQADGNSVQKTDITTGSVSAAVTTFAGQQVFAMQLLDQSPVSMDEVVFGDIIADLASKVDVYVLNKASIGILNVASINSVTYTDASPTVGELYPKVADSIQRIHTSRFLPPQAIVMHPSRWAWHLASLDSTGRPLVVPNANGPQNAFAGMGDVRSEGSVGSLQGLPVYVDPNVPTTLGGGTEDAIIVARFDDLYLWEGDVRTRVLFETDADTLSVRLQVWEYAAFLGGRYPKAIAKITGTGLAAATF
jgi:HK97 family phage major capsid protein